MAAAIRLLAAIVAVGAWPSSARAADWPPADPAEPQARVAFTADRAGRQRDLHRFPDLQAAAGARGRITAVETQSETPRVVYGRTGLDGGGSMQAFVYRDGAFATIVSLADNGGDVLFNTFGAFVCPACSPPVNACGGRPSWVPHDLHWDNFDCGHTLTGPQSLYSRDRR